MHLVVLTNQITGSVRKYYSISEMQNNPPKFDFKDNNIIECNANTFTFKNIVTIYETIKDVAFAANIVINGIEKYKYNIYYQDGIIIEEKISDKKVKYNNDIRMNISDSVCYYSFMIKVDEVCNSFYHSDNYSFDDLVLIIQKQEESKDTFNKMLSHFQSFDSKSKSKILYAIERDIFDEKFLPDLYKQPKNINIDEYINEWKANNYV